VYNLVTALKEENKMSDVLYIKQMYKSFLWVTLVPAFSVCSILVASDTESDGKNVSTRTSIMSQSDEELVDNPLPLSISKEERRRIWTEEAPRWADSWGITVDDYLERADKIVNYLRKKKKNISGRESLIRHKGQSIEAYNEAFSEQYGKVFTIDDLHMFTLRE
jgi:hypothetical protein